MSSGRWLLVPSRSLSRVHHTIATASLATNGYDLWSPSERNNTDASQYIIFGGVISGIGTGAWYVAESGCVLSLAPAGARGKYLAFWIVARNLGQLVGGAINLSKNHVKGAEAGVTPDTYVAFLIIECLA